MKLFNYRKFYDKDSLSINDVGDDPIEFFKKVAFLIEVFPISIAKFILILQKKYFHNDHVILYVRKDHFEPL